MEQPTGSALAIIETMTAVQIFAPKSVDSLIERIQREVRSIKRDISTPEGRAAIGRLDRELASRKRKIDELGKQLNSTKRAEIDQVDAERRKWRTAMEALQAEVTAERDAYEAAEAERVKGHTDAIARLQEMTIFGEPDPSADTIRERMAGAARFAGGRQWDIDFRARASDVAAEVRDKLEAMLIAAERRESEAAELAKLRAEQAERERQAAEEQQRHREAELARKAAEAARVAAEQEAQRKLDEAAQATERAQQQAREAEEKAAAQARQAAADKLAAEEQAKQAAAEAERRQAAAVEAERLRIERERAKAEYEAAEAKRKQELEDKRRAENKAHRQRINKAALDALILCGLPEEMAKVAIVAIARGDVPNVSITY